MKIMTAITAVLLATPAFALNKSAGDGWVFAVESTQVRFDAKKGSFDLTCPTDGIDGIFRRRHVDDETIVVMRIGVSAADCKKQNGTLHYMALDCRKLGNTSDFVFGAGNVASALAQYICTRGMEDWASRVPGVVKGGATP